MKAAILSALALLLSACSKDIQNAAAVRQGVMDHLHSRSDFGLNLDAMEIQISSVKFRENEADAVVAFVAKNAPSGTGMSMNYTLERDGDHWKVKNRAMTGTGQAPQPGAGATLPPGHVPVAPKGTN